MTDLKRFLKVLSIEGYPNPNLQSIARMVDYNLDNLLVDLVNEFGEDKANEFTRKAVEKMSSPEGVRIDDQDDPIQYAYIKIINPHIYLDNDETTVTSDWSWGDTNVFFRDDDGNESYKTIPEIGEQLSMGDWSDFDEMVDEIREECNKLFYKNCGFGIWWEEQIH